jgi:hypothetical protein
MAITATASKMSLLLINRRNPLFSAELETLINISRFLG